MLSGPWNTAPITHATQCNSHTTYLMAQQIRLMPLVNLVCKISILVQPVQHKPYPAPPARLWIAFVLINNAQPDCGPRLPISIIPPDTLTTVSHQACADDEFLLFCLFSFKNWTLQRNTSISGSGWHDHSHFTAQQWLLTITDEKLNSRF